MFFSRSSVIVFFFTYLEGTHIKTIMLDLIKKLAFLKMLYEHV
jgi:hypothetical protein